MRQGRCKQEPPQRATQSHAILTRFFAGAALRNGPSARVRAVAKTTFCRNFFKNVGANGVNLFTKLYLSTSRPFRLPLHRRVTTFPIPRQKILGCCTMKIVLFHRHLGARGITAEASKITFITITSVAMINSNLSCSL
jgi:hypothetical protein